jgi:hypothetical protein
MTLVSLQTVVTNGLKILTISVISQPYAIHQDIKKGVC